MRLDEAVGRFRNEEGAPSNVYEWYRRLAREKGYVELGSAKVRAWKSGRAWQVDDQDVAKAIGAHRQQREELKRITQDNKWGLLHGKDGDTILLLHGSYRRRDPFRFVWSDIEVGRRESNGTWYCNRCNRPAQTKYGNPECNLCADWNGCGGVCTLSEVSCERCGLMRTAGLT